MTVRPPFASHTLLVNLGPQSASLVSCFLLLDRQARPVPVCAVSRTRISWQLPLWGQDPTGRRAKCKTAAHVPFTFIRGGLLGLGYLSAASCLGRDPSGWPVSWSSQAPGSVVVELCGGESASWHQRIRSRCKDCSEEADISMPAGLGELEGAAHAAGKDL